MSKGLETKRKDAGVLTWSVRVTEGGESSVARRWETVWKPNLSETEGKEGDDQRLRRRLEKDWTAIATGNAKRMEETKTRAESGMRRARRAEGMILISPDHRLLDLAPQTSFLQGRRAGLFRGLAASTTLRRQPIGSPAGR